MEGEVFDTYNVAQVLDFSKQDCYLAESVDAFFDVDHENESRNDTKSRSNHRSNSDEVFFSPLSETCLVEDIDEAKSNKEPLFPMRKSMSVGNLVLFSEEEYREEYRPNLNNICEGINDLNVSPQEASNERYLERNIVDNKPNLYKNGCQSMNYKDSRDFQNNLNKLAQPKHYGSIENLKQGNGGKFVSLAEAVSQFQNRTPLRFRSKPNLYQKPFEPLTRTVPESPALQTKARSRPAQQRILSHEEKEQIEFENSKKFKIKAHPVNKKILQGPLKPIAPIETKKYTVPKPFNITAAPPKKSLPSPPKYEFHAKPVPRSAEKPRKTLEQQLKKSTKPITPSFMKNYKAPSHKSEETHQIKALKHVERPLGPTKPVPFSFDLRHKMVQQKREQLIKKIRAEERRAREFHAKPVPKSIYKKSDSVKSESVKSDGSSRKHTGSTESLNVHFKARPPLVLYKEVFVPAKAEKPPTQPVPFNLSSELRSHEREEFEKEKKLKEMKLELIKKIQEEELLKLEREETAKLRKEAEYKAQPIKKYKPVIIQPSGKITLPVSPKFHSRTSKNKENIPDNN